MHVGGRPPNYLKNKIRNGEKKKVNPQALGKIPHLYIVVLIFEKYERTHECGSFLLFIFNIISLQHSP